SPHAQKSHVPLDIHLLYVIFINLINVLVFNPRPIRLRSDIGTSSIKTDTGSGNIRTSKGNLSAGSGNTSTLKTGAATDSASEGTATKKGRTVPITTEYMQNRRNDIKARTTLLLALPDEHQLRFSKYKTAQDLWAAILNTFGGNESTKKTKKNLLKQQYGNFKAEGSETLEQT
nr:ribonuclease H-like domain-containing protein [Tanacetum cinerariifolium]